MIYVGLFRRNYFRALSHAKLSTKAQRKDGVGRYEATVADSMKQACLGQ